MVLRGRTVTLLALVALAVYMLRGGGSVARQNPVTLGEQMHSPPSRVDATLPSVTAGTQDDEGDADQDDDEGSHAAFDDDFIRSANSSELLARLRAGAHRAVATGQWRRNRKKITPLTRITSVKPSREAVQQPTDEQPQELESSTPGTTAFQSQGALEWLADQWNGNRPGPSARRRVRRTGAGAATLSDLSPSERVAARAERRKRWMAHGSRTLCFQLQKMHKVVPGVTWGSLPQAQRSAWDALQCDTHVAARNGLGGNAPAATAMPPATGSVDPIPKHEAAESQLRAFAHKTLVGSGGGRASSVSDDESDLTPSAECAEMAAAHRVVARVTWGSLPEELRTRWLRLGCDDKVGNVVRQQMREAAREQQPQMAQPRPLSRRSRAATSYFAKECIDMQLTHGVLVGQSWGSLPLHGQRRWTRLGCDGHVKDHAQ